MGVWREKFADWVKSLSARQKILIGIVVAFVAIAILYQIPGSGFGKDENESETKKGFLNPKDGKIIVFTEKTTNHQSAKTLWDWLQLGGVIAIPFALLYFERREQRRSDKRAQQEKEQANREKEIAEEQAKREKEIAEEQVKREKEIADNNLREQALEAYFDRMAELLIDKHLKVLIGEELEESSPKYRKRDAALDIARARTLSVLRRLGQDGERKGNVIRFLIDAELIEHLDLNSADLSNADLSNADLSHAILSFAYLSDANLIGADLSSADLYDADLGHANLIVAKLIGADLIGADLNGADLRSADLSDADLNGADLRDAKILDPEQVKSAKNWEKAKYSEEFRAKLGLPPEPAE